MKAPENYFLRSRVSLLRAAEVKRGEQHRTAETLRHARREARPEVQGEGVLCNGKTWEANRMSVSWRRMNWGTFIQWKTIQEF